MPDRRLVVAELDPNDPHYGEMFGLSPNTATGVPIPAFTTGPTLPATGNGAGEAFYEQRTRKGFVWDGAAWREIAASPVKRFANRTALLADTTEPTGTFAVTGDTGEVYIRQATGWAFIGIKEYATAAQLLADSPQPGAIATALDEGSLWERQTAGWRCLTIRELADLAAVQAWTGTAAQGAHVGDTALALDNELTYVRTSGGWRPESLWEDTEANIRAATWPLNGQEAIATDTGRTFVRIGGTWIEEPIQHYATEALLLAATVPDGTLAWSDDTNVAFTRAGGTWHRLAGPQISVGTTAPATPGAGDQWFDQNAGQEQLKLWDGTQWVSGAPKSPTTPISLQIPATANTAEIDLGRGNWRQASVHLTGEARGGSNFLVLAMKHSNGNWTTNRDQLIDVYVTSQYGTTPYAHRDIPQAHAGDWFYLTWAKNSANFRIGGAYFDLQITLNRLYDNVLTMHHSITYFSTTNTVTRVEGLWTFNEQSQNQDVRFLALKSSGDDMRLGFVGSKTVV